MVTEEIIDDFLSKGKYSFTLDEFRKAYDSTNTSVKRALSKLSKKGRIRSIKKGFYVIVTPEYKSSVIPPVTDLLDGLMNDFNKAYYLGLLSAAALHGAAHQQPLVSMVIIPKPALRNINLINHRIMFLTKSKWLQQGVIRKNVRTGYINISNPALTAIDLIQYQTKCGGISRIYDILSAGPGQMAVLHFQRGCCRFQFDHF